MLAKKIVIMGYYRSGYILLPARKEVPSLPDLLKPTPPSDLHNLSTPWPLLYVGPRHHRTNQSKSIKWPWVHPCGNRLFHRIGAASYTTVTANHVARFLINWRRSADLWHARLAYVNYERLKVIMRKEMVRGLPSMKRNWRDCVRWVPVW